MTVYTCNKNLAEACKIHYPGGAAFHCYISDYANFKVTIEDNGYYEGDIICDNAEGADKIIRELARVFARRYEE